eukprot:1829266-Prymnesium_polylepis.1
MVPQPQARHPGGAARPVYSDPEVKPTAQSKMKHATHLPCGHHSNIAAYFIQHVALVDAIGA